MSDGIKSVTSHAWDHDPQARSREYSKKQTGLSVEQPPASIYASSIASLNPTIEQKSIAAPVSTKISVFDKASDWVKDKWNSFLGFAGIRKPPVDLPASHRTHTPKTAEHTISDIEEDFTYLDTTDPLKTMLILLVKQGHLREEQALLLQEKIRAGQLDLKQIHNEHSKIQAQLALVSKDYKTLEKVNVAVTVGQVISGFVSAATTVAFAATIATGGAATPLLVVVGAFNAVTYGAKAVYTWFKGRTEGKLNDLQKEMLSRSGKREDLQFQLRVSVKDMRTILNTLIGLAENGSSLLAAQYGK